MKFKNSTKQVMLSFALIFGFSMLTIAQDMGTGTGWATINPTSALVLNEDFTGFTFFGNWAHANNSNSKDVLDELTGQMKRGTTEGTKSVDFLNSTAQVVYTWDSCAFAPEWGVSKSVDNDGLAVDPDPTTTGVSNGFVEISRNGYGTLAGEFIIDLRGLEYVEAIQYSHSSCGGQRRGFMIFYSLDDGSSWDTLRYQMGDHYSMNFIKDLFTGEATPTNINCTPSASGMLWEDGIYESNVMLMFSATNTVEPQAVRIHDFKVYGDLKTSKNALSNNMNVRVNNNMVTVSENSMVEVYNITGKLLKSVQNTSQFSIGEFSNGVYLLKVKGTNSGNVHTQKIIKR